MLPYGLDKIGSLKEEYGEPALDKSIWTDIDLAKAFAFGVLVGILLGIVL
jgi:hypothetical protein